MSAEENARVAKELSDAFDANDFQKIDALMDDDIVWHEIGKAEPRRGKAALQALAPGSGETDYEITGESHDILASDDHAIQLVNATGTRGGKTLHYRTAEIYHIRDGKVVERWAFSDDTAAIAEFFA
ncbi:MAG TPA: nuclear transport factor 2 family protein [Candidatus Limnocylindrales bacterium]|jgi:ketosteroid isomerase-like protein